MKTISIVTPCYNEELNVRELYERVRAAIASLGDYRYEHIFIDNASTDNTLGVLKVMAAMDKNVKVILNTRNFGHIRSPIHAFHQATRRRRHRHRRRSPGPARDDRRHGPQMGGRNAGRHRRQGRQRRERHHVLGPHALLPPGQPPLRNRNLRELHRLRPL